MYLFFDTETNGKVKDMGKPMSDVDNFPRITQLAWQLYDKDGLLIIEQSEMIFPSAKEMQELKREQELEDEIAEERKTMDDDDDMQEDEIAEETAITAEMREEAQKKNADKNKGKKK